MAAPLKVPPSIANASREELERLLITTLQKLKARDKRIEELNKNAIPQQAVGDSDEFKQAAAERDQAQGHVKELEAAVTTLKSKLQASEQTIKNRLAAETDTQLLRSQISKLRKELDSVSSEVDSERDATRALQEQLSSREALIAQLQDKLGDAEAREAVHAEQVQLLKGQLSQAAETGHEAVKEATTTWAQERQALQSRAETADQQAVAAAQVAEAAQNEAQAFQSRCDAVCAELAELKIKYDILTSESQASSGAEAAKIEQLTSDLESVRQEAAEQVESLKKELTAAQEQAAALSKDVVGLKTELEKVETAAQDSVDQGILAIETSAQIESLKSELAAAREEANARSKEVTALIAKLAELEETSKANAEKESPVVESSSAEVESLRIELHAAQEHVSNLTQEVSELNSRLEQETMVATTAAKAVNTENEISKESAGQVDALQKEIIAAKKELAALKTKLTESETATSLSTTTNNINNNNKKEAEGTEEAAAVRVSLQNELINAQEQVTALTEEIFSLKMQLQEAENVSTQTAKEQQAASAAAAARSESLQNELV